MLIQAHNFVKPNGTCYISCGCNSTPFCMDWGHNGIICYGSCNSIAVYDPKDRGGGRVLTTLVGHKNRINAVRWIRAGTPHMETEFVSVSCDKTAIVWSLLDGEFHATATLTGHTDGVTVVDALYLGTDLGVKFAKAVVVTGSTDSTIKYWERGDTEAEFFCTTTINLGYGICTVLSLVCLPGQDSLLLACGEHNSRIHLYSKSNKVMSLIGHDDWVRSLDFTTEDNGDVLLISGSQDTAVRIWRLSNKICKDEDPSVLKQKELFGVINGVKWSVILEAILFGHEGWVYSVQWSPKIQIDGEWKQRMEILSCSLDRTIVLWAPEEETGVWLEKVRVGELGGNTLGYYGGRFGPEGNSILGHTFQGGFHMWSKSQDIWKPGVAVGGHFGGVEDIGWEAEGSYLLSVGLDQTTRLHAPWISQSDKSDSEHSWHEICRPQVHGYDIWAIAILPKFSFVSASEEKVARVFTAPQNALQNLSTLSKLVVDETVLTGSMPCGAAVPSLGLSNKAVFAETKAINTEVDKHPKDEYSDVSFTPHQLNEPGSEDYLVQNSLWPEVMKLYGHGYEVFSLASSHSGSLVASACKSTSAEHAKIILWNTKSWQKEQELEGHQLTVTQMEFSPDDRHLLSVSRDRRWCLFRQEGDHSYTLVATTDKKTGLHTRIIWTCSWSHDSARFATGSREGKLVVWGECSSRAGTCLGGYAALTAPLTVADSITAVNFAPGFFLKSGAYLIAVGGEKGWISLYSWANKEEPWLLCYKIEENLAHNLTVKRLAFRPKFGKAEDTDEESKDVLQLASCSTDHSVRVHNIFVQSVNF